MNYLTNLTSSYNSSTTPKWIMNKLFWLPIHKLQITKSQHGHKNIENRLFALLLTQINTAITTVCPDKLHDQCIVTHRHTMARLHSTFRPADRYARRCPRAGTRTCTWPSLGHRNGNGCLPVCRDGGIQDTRKTVLNQTLTHTSSCEWLCIHD